MDNSLPRNVVGDDTFDAALNRYVEHIRILYADYRTENAFFNSIHDRTVEVSVGPSFVKVIMRESHGGGSVHSFVARKANAKHGIKPGDVLKPAGATAPELKNPRGNILDGSERITHHGPIYLR